MLKFHYEILIVLVTILSYSYSTSYDDYSVNQPFQNISVSYSHSNRVFHPSPVAYQTAPYQPENHNAITNRNPFSFIPQSVVNNNFNPTNFQKKIFNLHYPLDTPPDECQTPMYGPCQESKYRSIDGSCNHLRNPILGTASTPYNRLLHPRYSDGIHQPPISVTGSALPGSRLVSIVMFPDHPIPDPVWTLVSMQWGQVITHDMSMAMGNTQAKLIASQCCSPDGRLFVPTHEAPAQCFPIEIPPDDPLYSKHNQMCMNFMRTTTDVDRGCVHKHEHEPQEQLVAVTHYMDASLVYGSNIRVANSLREGNGGRLLVDIRHGKQWPPSANNKSATCDNQDDDEPCYRFGDVRGNQNPQLTLLQIVLLREHNRIAAGLEYLNPHWDDERIYQEARRILIAEYQHINYYEWLPIFLGRKEMEKYNLLYNAHGHVNDYDENMDPRVINSHATAAFRYFHSAIQGRLELITKRRQISGELRLSDYFNRPGVLEEDDVASRLTRGMATQSQENVDQWLTSEITDYLFRNGRPFGQDLRAIDIQRGRDHGLSSYNDYRHICGLPKASKFEDFGDYLSEENIRKLSILYAHPDDVDLVVGASLEAHVPDTLSGPTFLCIMLEQFYRTRTGDRYFYENSNHPGAFTPDQLREIKKASISRLLCDNGDNIKYMQPEGFRVIGSHNPVLPCNNIEAIPVIDLRYWAESTPKRHHFGSNGYFFNKK